MDVLIFAVHSISLLLHLIFGSPFLDLFLSVGLFAAGRMTGGIGIFMRVAILLIRMAVHFYNTHPQAHKLKRNSTIDNEFAKLYKEHVSSREDLKEGHETGAKG